MANRVEPLQWPFQRLQMGLLVNVDGTSVLGADIALAIACRGIVGGKKDLENQGQINLCWVVGHLNHFSMTSASCTDFSIGRILDVPP